MADHDHTHTHDHGEAGAHEHPHSHGPDHAHGHGHTHAHGSGHSHSHDHGDGHGHSHGPGLIGWFRGTFAHSHDISDKVDESMESNERGIWALKISLLGLGLTALFQVLIVWISGSVALLADTIHNFADAATSIPLWIAFALARRGASRRFTYGYGKTEDVAGVVIVGVIFFSACVAAYEAGMKIIHPQPITHLWWVAAAALVGFIGNEVVGVFRIRVGKEIGSAALVADGYHSRVDGFTSLAVLIGVIGVAVGVPILDPIVGVGITIAILFIVKDAAAAVWRRLIEGIEPEILAQIEHAPMHVEGVREVQRVRARWLGHKIHSDVEIGVDPEISVREACVISSAVEQSVRGHVRNLGEVVVQLRPAGAGAGVPLALAPDPGGSDPPSPAHDAVIRPYLLVTLALPLLALSAGRGFAHPDSPGSPPLVPSSLRLKYRKPAEILALFARERLPDATGAPSPRAARTDEPESLLPYGVDGLLRTGDTDEVILAGTEGVPDVRACIQVLDVPVETIGANREKIVLTLRHADARRLRTVILHLPEAGSAVLQGRQLALEGKPAWLHRALRQVIRAELNEPESFGLR